MMKYFSIAFASVMALLLFSNTIAHHNSPESLEARVAPVGTLNIGSGSAATSADSTDLEDGEVVYDTTCATCHDDGIAGAPILGEIDDWEERIEQGMNSLVEHAIIGFTGSFGVMPPKGGNAALSDSAVAAAVQFMVDEVE